MANLFPLYFSASFLSLSEFLQPDQRVRVSNGDEHITGIYLLFTARIEEHLTICAFDGYNHYVELGTYPRLAQLFIGQRRSRSNFHLFESKIELTRSNGINEIIDGRLCQRYRHSMTADDRRSYDTVGSGAQQLLL